jgi:hypothetical protein
MIPNQMGRFVFTLSGNYSSWLEGQVGFRNIGIQAMNEGGFHGHTLLAIPLDGLTDRFEQLFVVEGLGKEVYRACFHGIHTRGDIAMTGDENYRDSVRRMLQLLLELELELEPIQAGHQNIKQ